MYSFSTSLADKEIYFWTVRTICQLFFDELRLTKSCRVCVSLLFFLLPFLYHPSLYHGFYFPIPQLLLLGVSQRSFQKVLIDG